MEKIDLEEEIRVVGDDMVRYEKRLTWKIRNYLKWARTVSEEFVRSPSFEFRLNSKEKYKFCFRIYPKGSTNNNEYLSFFLENEASTEVTVETMFYVEQRNGARHNIGGKFTTDKYTAFGEQSCCWGKSKAIKLSTLTENSDVLIDNSLVIGVTIAVTSLKIKNNSLERNLSSQSSLMDELKETFRQRKLKGKSVFEKMSDFTIICGNDSERSFPCHKLFLALRSPVFEAMLFHNTKEAMEGKVYITDVSPNTMESLVEFIYTDNVNENEISADLLVASNKYQIGRLKALCEHYLVQHLTHENAAEILVQGYLSGSPEFLEEVIQYVSMHWKKIMETEGFTLIKQHSDLLTKIISNLTS